MSDQQQNTQYNISNLHNCYWKHVLTVNKFFSYSRTFLLYQ